MLPPRNVSACCALARTAFLSRTHSSLPRRREPGSLTSAERREALKALAAGWSRARGPGSDALLRAVSPLRGGQLETAWNAYRNLSDAVWKLQNRRMHWREWDPYLTGRYPWADAIAQAVSEADVALARLVCDGDLADRPRGVHARKAD